MTISQDTVAYAHWTLTYIVFVDSDYACTTENQWDIATGTTVPSNMNLYITLTMLPTSGLGNSTYQLYEYSGGWTAFKKFNGGASFISRQSTSGTLQLTYKTNIRVLVQNQFVGTGMYTNDKVHIKIWAQ